MMKPQILFFIFLVLSSLVTACAPQDKENSAEAQLENINAIKALAIANQWKWSKKEIKSFVTPREVVFKFPNEKVKKITLPEEKMVVAVAPFIKRTHK